MRTTENWTHSCTKHLVCISYIVVKHEASIVIVETLVVLEPQTCAILMMEGNWGVPNSITLVSDKATEVQGFRSLFKATK